MEKNLTVPYASQWDADAGRSYNDCGAASVRMILNYYGDTELTTDAIQDKTGAGKGLVGIEQLQSAIRAFGYSSEFYTNQNFQNIKNLLDKDIPVIVLVHYGSLVSTQDKNFKGGHWMSVVGYRDDNSVYTNDPNFKDKFRKDGDHHVYTQDEFLKAWGSCNEDGNPNNSFIVINRRSDNVNLPISATLVVTPEVGLKSRTNPTLNSDNVSKIFNKGAELKAIARVTGDTVNNNHIWYQIENGGNPLYVWSGGVEVKQEVKIEEAPKEDTKEKDAALAAVAVEANNRQQLELLTAELEKVKKENAALRVTLNKISGMVTTFSNKEPLVASGTDNVTPVKANMFGGLMDSLHLNKWSK